MKNYEITEENVSAAFEAAKSDETKEVLAALFGEKESKPDLDDYKSIKTYEDACETLGEKPIGEDTLKHVGVPDHIIALMKLETISRALWGKSFQPNPDADGFKYYSCPLFALYTKEEIRGMNDDDKSAILPTDSYSGAYSGFGYLSVNSRIPTVNKSLRLRQETQEKAIYFGKQFVELWANYLAFNFTIIK